MKQCNRCKETKSRELFYKMKGKRYSASWDCRDSQCISCRLITSRERLQRVKQQAVEYLGGKCTECGLETTEYCVYDFHHTDPTQKDFGIGKNVKSFARIVPELDKCELLCSNCHRIRHYGKEV